LRLPVTSGEMSDSSRWTEASANRRSDPGGLSHAPYAETAVNRNSSSRSTSATESVPRRLTPRASTSDVSSGSLSGRGRRVNSPEQLTMHVRASCRQPRVDHSASGVGIVTAPSLGRGASCSRATSTPFSWRCFPEVPPIHVPRNKVDIGPKYATPPTVGPFARFLAYRALACVDSYIRRGGRHGGRVRG